YIQRLFAFHHFSSSFKNCLSLHFGDFRIQDAQTAATATQHRVLFVQSLDAVNYELQRQAEFVGQLTAYSVVLRQELMQRRIQQTDGHRTALHCLEQAYEILALRRQQLFQGFAALYGVHSQDHLAHVVNTAAFEEHVFSTAQANTFCTIGYRLLRHGRSVGVGTDAQFAVLVGPFHHSVEQLVGVAVFRLHVTFEYAFDFRVSAFDQAFVNGTGSTVDGDIVAFTQYNTVCAQGFLFVV